MILNITLLHATRVLASKVSGCLLDSLGHEKCPILDKKINLLCVFCK